MADEREGWLDQMEAEVFRRAGMAGVTPMGVTATKARYGPFWLDVARQRTSADRKVNVIVRADGLGFIEGNIFDFTLDDDAMNAGSQIADWIEPRLPR